MENLEKLTKLEQLYVSENGLKEIEGLETNLELSTLDLASNKISQIQNIAHLSKLEEFWVSNTSIHHCDLHTDVFFKCNFVIFLYFS